MHIKKGDEVVILSGDDKGKKGKVAHVLPKNNTAVVEGLNLKKKHTKRQQNGKSGQVIEVAMPLQVSKLALANKAKKK
jgi:large subunit ribosomal protein L24